MKKESSSFPPNGCPVAHAAVPAAASPGPDESCTAPAAPAVPASESAVVYAGTAREPPLFSADSQKGASAVGGLSSHRATSSIPSRKGLWLYPSEQQFYSTTLSKGVNVTEDYDNRISRLIRSQ